MSADGDLVLDRRAHVASRGGAELALTAREFALLDWFLRHPGEVHRRDDLMRAVWGWEFGDESTVTVHVRRLREKVEADPSAPSRLVTVFGVGYRWDARPPDTSLMIPPSCPRWAWPPAVTLVVGLLGVLLVVALTRRSVGRAAVAAPVVVVLAVAAGVYASARAMFLQPEDSTTVLLVLLAAVPVAAVLGGLVARRVIESDRAATAQRMASELQTRAEADRRELVAWVSHDLRTPLAGIWAISEAVEDGVATDVPAAMRQVRDSVRQMGDLVDTLLALSRLQAAEPALEMSEVDVGDLVSEAVAALLPLADVEGVRLTGSAGPHGAGHGGTR